MMDDTKRKLRLRIKRERAEAGIARRCGLNRDKIKRLMDADYDNIRKLKEATDEELKAIPGIGPGQLKKIRDGVDGG